MTTSTFLHNLVRQLRQLDRCSDAELLDCFQVSGDPEAFEALVRRHGACVLAACRKVLTSSADIDDAFQATFIVLFKNARTIRQREVLGGWLTGVAHRVALKALSAAVRRQRAEQRFPRLTTQAPDLSWQEACAILHEELDRLPDQYRLPLLLCYLEGKSRDEAAQQLGVGLDVVRGRLARGRERLRGRLVKRGITLSAGLLAVVARSARAGGPTEALLRATLTAATTGQISSGVAALIRGVAPSMTLGKGKLLAVLVVALGLISGGVGLHRHGAPPSMDPPPAHVPAKKAAEAVADEKLADADNAKVAVAGKVVGPDGKPVSKAKLFVFDSAEWKPAPQMEANPDGSFAFELPPLANRRSYRFVVATAPELGLGCDWAAVVATSDMGKGAMLKLPKDEPIQGRIVDLEGKPVGGATIRVTDLQTGPDDTLNDFVRLWSKDKEQQQQAFSTLIGKRLFAKKALAEHFTATTDKDGKFTLRGIGRDRCPQLSISAKGMASQVCVVAIRGDFKPVPGGFTGSPVLGPDFTLPLTPTVPISGVVRDAATKKPLAGIRVLGQADLSDQLLTGYLILPEVETVTDADGRYTLDGLPKAKKYVLVADPKAGEGPIHQFVTPANEAPGFEPLKADFALPRGVVLAGQITDKKTGKPVHAHVFYRPLWSNKAADYLPGYASPGIAPWYSHESTWSDADGRFKITALPGPGLLHVQVLDDERGREYMPAKLAAEDDIDEVVHKEGNWLHFKTGGQGGHFSPSSLNAYRVLRLPADAKTATMNIALDPGVTRVLKLADPEGEPLRGAWVLNDRIFTSIEKPRASAECTVTALDPDKPRLVYAQHDERKLAGFIALDGKNAEAAILKLRPMATVTGRLVNADGKPLKDCRIEASYEDAETGNLLHWRERNNSSPILTDSEGRFTRTVPAGLAVRFGVKAKDGKYTKHQTAKQTLKTGETLDLGEWKPN